MFMRVSRDSAGTICQLLDPPILLERVERVVGAINRPIHNETSAYANVQISNITASFTMKHGAIVISILTHEENI